MSSAIEWASAWISLFFTILVLLWIRLISGPPFGAVSLMIYVIWHYKTGSRDKHAHARLHSARTHTLGSPLSSPVSFEMAFIFDQPQTLDNKNNNRSNPAELSKTVTSLRMQDPAMFGKFVSADTGACEYLCMCPSPRLKCFSVCLCAPTYVCVSKSEMFNVLSATCSFISIPGVTECSIPAFDFYTSQLCIGLLLQCVRLLCTGDLSCRSKCFIST